MTELQANIDRVHTTDLGLLRIRRNLNLCTDDAVAWCKQQIAIASIITQKGKNWYVNAGNALITVQAHSYTIITAKKVKMEEPEA
jgi:hypothetical protein